MFSRPRSLFLAIALTGSALLSPVQAGTEDRDNHAATGAGWYYNQTIAGMQAVIARGNRIVDLEVVRTSPTTLVTFSYVPNTGSFRRDWWWAVDFKQSDLINLYQNRQARLTDLEVYVKNGEVRMAALMERNTGSDRKTWWWYVNSTPSAIASRASTLGARVVDFESYVVGSRRYYAAILLRNTGADRKSWWFYSNTTASSIASRLQTNNARLWDIDRIGSDRYDVAMVRWANEKAWYYYGQTASSVTALLGQLGGRLADIDQYNTIVGPRFNIVILNSANAVSRRVCDQMRSRTNGWVGTYLRRVGSLTSYNLAYINGDRRFEPASTLKSLHLVRAMREVATTPLSLGSSWTVRTRTSSTNSCPVTTLPYSMSVQKVLEGMMRASNNALTKVVTDRYGMSGLNSLASSFGMTNTRVNHHIGCGTPANYTTLVDMGKLYERVVKGYLGTQRQAFYDIHATSFYNNGYYAEGYLKNVIDQEAARVGLTATQRAMFVNNMVVRGKKGGYRISGKFHRAWAGYVSLPIWTNSGVSKREFVTGAFVNDATNEPRAIAGAATGAAEVLREQIHSAMQTLKNHVFGSITTFGSSCRGNLFQPYVHSATGTPNIGQRVLYRAASSQRVSSSSMLYIGLSKTFWGRTRLPLHMGFMKAPGCYIRVSLDIAVPLPVRSGQAQLLATLPNNRSLVGLPVHTQFLVLAPGANAANLVATNGVTTVIGGQR